jgi:hypothetical protein
VKFYTFYDTETGQITRISFLDDAMVEANLQSGEGYLEGRFDAATQKIVDGAITDIDASVIEDNKQQDALNDFREMRNSLLADTDWTQGNDSPLSDTEKQNYRTLRQNLRDMPQADGFDPLNPVWPTLP